jgi:hypothetical protein
MNKLHDSPSPVVEALRRRKCGWPAATAWAKGSGETVIWLGLGAILAAVVGVAAGGFYFGGVNRTLMSWILLIAAVCHLVAIPYFGIAGFIFLLLAAMLALADVNRLQRRALRARRNYGS